MSKYGPMRVWNTQTNRNIRELPFYAEDFRGTFSPDGRLYAEWGKGKVEVWDLTTGNLQRSLPVKAEWVNHLRFSPDGASLVAGVSDVIGLSADVPLWQSGREQAQLKLWDLKTGALQKTLYHWPGDAYSIVFSTDGKSLAVATREKTMQLWDVAEGQLILTLAMLPSEKDLQLSNNWVAFTPSGHFQASPGAEEFIRWRLGNDILPFSTYAPTYQRPNLVQQVFSQR